MKYFDAITQSMRKLASISNALFIGQATDRPGTAMFKTLKDIPSEKKIEMPVAENMQLGMSIGLSLNGFLPISIFPRWNFLLSATDQLVNHLDKLEEYSKGEYKPKVIIRVGVGSSKPLFPGEQHVGDMSWGFEELLDYIDVYQLDSPSQVLRQYNKIIENPKSVILVEYMDLY